MNVECPFCKTVMIQERPNHPELWFRCPNKDCRCEDGGMSLANNARPLKWIERKRQHIKDTSNPETETPQQ